MYVLHCDEQKRIGLYIGLGPCSSINSHEDVSFSFQHIITSHEDLQQ